MTTNAQTWIREARERAAREYQEMLNKDKARILDQLYMKFYSAEDTESTVEFPVRLHGGHIAEQVRADQIYGRRLRESFQEDGWHLEVKYGGNTGDQFPTIFMTPKVCETE